MSAGSSTADARTLVRYEVREGVAYLTLDDPPANTYTHEMMRQLDEAILRARFDTQVHVLVLTGQGEKFFCAGADISMLSTAEPNFKYYFCLHANETLNRLEHTPKLVIAALNGHTVGGGLEIAMAADLRIARSGGSKIGLPEINLGVLPGTGGTQRFARTVGKSKAIELMVTGANFSLEEAKNLSLVNQIFDAESSEDFQRQVHAYALQFCPPHRAAKAAGRIKRAVQSGLEVPFECGLTLERELQQQLFESSDAKEGLNAYIEKRRPSFKGV
jgi:enoyl-CoA hydratase/carnithine racemase